ncbi:MAG TPA: hypothetical protein VN414_11450 [Methanosarcina sp.]|nr:hypothetical protein [Methanosarcina sp.]
MITEGHIDFFSKPESIALIGSLTKSRKAFLYNTGKPPENEISGKDISRKSGLPGNYGA